VSQEWLIKFVEHRVGDRRIIRLIQKWLKAGVLEDGIVTVSDKGTGQGSVISPLLANLYLHYAFDLWAERWRRREAAGNMIIVRYADDLIVGFEHETDARRFLDEMRKRLQEFALSLHSEKTRLIEFGRFAVENRKRRGLGKPETFTFLGFTFICGKTRRGKFQIKRKSRRDRMQAKLQAIKQELRRSMHQPIPQQGRWLQQVVTGYFNYHAVPTNSSTLTAFLFHVTNLWRRTLWLMDYPNRWRLKLYAHAELRDLAEFYHWTRQLQAHLFAVDLASAVYVSLRGTAALDVEQLLLIGRQVKPHVPQFVDRVDIGNNGVMPRALQPLSAIYPSR